MTDLGAADEPSDDTLPGEPSNDTGEAAPEPADVSDTGATEEPEMKSIDGAPTDEAVAEPGDYSADKAGTGDTTTDREDESGIPNSVFTWIDTLESEVRALDDRLTSLANATPTSADLDEMRAVINHFGEKTDSLEESVDELESTVDQVDETVTQIDATTTETSAELDTVVDKLDKLATAHESVAMQAEDTATKLTRLANAVVHTQRRLEPLERHVAAQKRLAMITETANANSVTTATCESCGENVQLTLLASPTCPHCSEPFRDIEPRTGFFRTSVLKVGDPPALDGEVSNGIADELTEADAGAER